MTTPESCPLRFPFEPASCGDASPEYRRRDEEDPLGVVELPTGDLVRFAVRYDDVRSILSDPRFSSDLDFPGAPRRSEGVSVCSETGPLTAMGPPRHPRLRRIVNGAFTPRAAERWRPHTRAIVARLIDEIAKGPQPADLIETFATVLPVQVICTLLGVPEADRDQFRAWSEDVLDVTTQSEAERQETGLAFMSYIATLVSERRGQPGDDLIHAMARARDEGDQLSEDDLNRIVRGLIIASHHTTKATIGRGLFRLLAHPDQYSALCAKPELVKGAVEEILRYDGPGDMGMIRVATEDVALSSGTLTKGMGVVTSLYGANRDPRRFDRPDTFDISRPESAHLAFGHGPHFCLGAHLARMELQVAIGGLVERLPHLELAVAPEEVRWSNTMLTDCVEYLPVVW